MYFCTAKRRVFLLKITSLAEHKIIQEVRYTLNGLCVCCFSITHTTHNILFQLLLTISLIVYGRKKKEEPKRLSNNILTLHRYPTKCKYLLLLLCCVVRCYVMLCYAASFVLWCRISY